MSTRNRRVAAYLPPEVDKAFIDFKIKCGLATEGSPNQNDSQALIQLLSEFLNVSHQAGYLVTHKPDAEWVGQLEELKASLVSQIGELSSELAALRDKVESLVVTQDLTNCLNASQLAKRLEISPSTLSHWRHEKKPKDLKDSIQKKDPEGIAWLFVPDIQLFKKESDIPKALQGELLGLNSAIHQDLVNPLPEGSERSGEG